MALPHNDHDLSDPGILLSYLEHTPFASTRVDKLSGGVTNFVFRLYLSKPYMEQGEQNIPLPTLILKHSKSWLSTDKEFYIDTTRQKVEACALRAVKKIFPEDSLVTIPKLFRHDEINHVLIMEDAGTESKNLKDLLRKRPLDSNEARKLGVALGEFLAIVHTQGSKDTDLMKQVSEFEESKKIYAGVTYERVVHLLKSLESKQNTGSTSHEANLRELSTRPFSEQDYEEIRALAESATKRILEASTVFTMGDFWTANIIVDQDSSGCIKRAFVVDWEIARAGLPYLDYGQLTAELHTLRLFYPEADTCVNEILASYALGYKRNSVVDAEFTRGAAIHVGAHLVAITQMACWEPKERIPQVMLEGAEYMLHGNHRDLDWLSRSAVRFLLL